MRCQAAKKKMQIFETDRLGQNKTDIFKETYIVRRTLNDQVKGDFIVLLAYPNYANILALINMPF